MKIIKLALLITTFLSLGMLTGCHEGCTKKKDNDSREKLVLWEPVISSDYFDPKITYFDDDQSR